MTTLPNDRYTGANTFTAADYIGNVFYAYQGPDDSGCVAMVQGGQARLILTISHSGRIALDCNPLVGLWAVGNKDATANQTPPRYSIEEYVPWPSGGEGIAGAPGSAGPGAVTLYAAPIACPAWDGRDLSGGALVDIPSAFGVESAPAYLVRFCATAVYPNVKIRAGSEAAPHFLTLTTQVPGIRKDCQGWIPGPVAYISTVDGQAKIWLQIIGR
jgi:hypothetical protein